MEAMLADSKATGCTREYSDVMESAILNCPIGVGPWDNASNPPYSNHLPNGTVPAVSQTWFDDVKATKAKVAVAKGLKLGGVGVFTGEGVGAGLSAAAYWAVLGSINALKTLDA